MKTFLLKCHTGIIYCSFLSGIVSEEGRRCFCALSVTGFYSTDNRLDTPTLMAAQRTCFNNLNHITNVTIIRFIVSQDLLGFSDNLLVKRMLISTNNRNGNSFVHVVTRHKTCLNLTMSLSFFVQIESPNPVKTYQCTHFRGRHLKNRGIELRGSRLTCDFYLLCTRPENRLYTRDIFAKFTDAGRVFLLS